MLTRHHPLVKATSYSVLGLIGATVRMWSPQQALVICTVAFALDGMVSSLIPTARRAPARYAGALSFMVALGSLLAGRTLAEFLGLG